jgi:dihydroxyacetone kinase-like protein
MKTEELKRRLLNGCKEVKAAEDELTLIDSHFGDADHGLTMKKIADAIEEAINKSPDEVKALFDAVAERVGLLNGGSAVPLWNSWLQGIADVAPEKDEASLEELKTMFAGGMEEFDFMSGAKVGDKTIMDALKPASDAIEAAEDEKSLFAEAAEAAMKGAQDTKNYTARYGRAKSYGEKTLGTADAGALSMALFFKGLAEE